MKAAVAIATLEAPNPIAAMPSVTQAATTRANHVGSMGIRGHPSPMPQRHVQRLVYVHTLPIGRNLLQQPILACLSPLHHPKCHHLPQDRRLRCLPQLLPAACLCTSRDNLATSPAASEVAAIAARARTGPGRARQQNPRRAPVPDRAPVRTTVATATATPPRTSRRPEARLRGSRVGIVACVQAKVHAVRVARASSTHCGRAVSPLLSTITERTTIGAQAARLRPHGRVAVWRVFWECINQMSAHEAETIRVLQDSQIFLGLAGVRMAPVRADAIRLVQRLSAAGLLTVHAVRLVATAW